MTNTNGAKSQEGLGGWLILAAVLLLGLCVRSGLDAMDIASLFEDGTFTKFGQLPHGGPNRTFILFVFTSNTLLCLAALVALYLFFSRSSWFPLGSSLLWSMALIFVGAEAVLNELAQPYGRPPTPVAAAFDAASRLAVITASWLVYMRKSTRVRATFGHGQG